MFISKMLEFQVVSYFLFLASKINNKVNSEKQLKTIDLTLKKSKANANATSTQKIRNT